VTVEDFIAKNFYSATTEAVIDWSELSSSIGSIEPISRRRRCELLLRAVNGDPLRMSDFSALAGAPLKTFPLAMSGDVSALHVPLFARARDALCASLQRVLDDPETAIDDVGGNTARIVNSHVIVIPEVRVISGKWIRRERILARSPAEALVYALNLFLDPELDFGKYLRRCNLDSCKRFAIGDPPLGRGQPPKYFCKDAHRDQFVREDAARRKRKERGSMQ
jgi:hypothetical protein